MNTNLLPKIGLTLMTLYYAYVPAMADIGDTHLHNHEWSAHSRVHLVWFLIFTGFAAVIAIVALWWKNAFVLNASIGLAFNGAFLIAAALASSYDGELGGGGGVPIQVIEFGTLAALFTVAVLWFATMDRRARAAVDQCI